jgi:hypothetical protein
MPPCLSMPLLPVASCSAAHLPRSLLMDSSNHASTKEANRGDSGHPWRVPS